MRVRSCDQPRALEQRRRPPAGGAGQPATQLLPAGRQRGQGRDLPAARELEFELGVLEDRLVAAQRDASAAGGRRDQPCVRLGDLPPGLPQLAQQLAHLFELAPGPGHARGVQVREAEQ